MKASDPTTVLDPLLTVEQVSAYTTLPVKTLYAYRIDGRGPRVLKVGRHLRYRRADVESWLDLQADKQPPAALAQ